jgi:hypothetical protein
MSYLDLYSASLLLFSFWLSTVYLGYQVGKRHGLRRQRSPLANNAATIARARNLR